MAYGSHVFLTLLSGQPDNSVNTHYTKKALLPRCSITRIFCIASALFIPSSMRTEDLCQSSQLTFQFGPPIKQFNGMALLHFPNVITPNGSNSDSFHGGCDVFSVLQPFTMQAHREKAYLASLHHVT